MAKGQHSIAPAYKIYGYFILGLATAIAFRALIVLDHIQPTWVRPVWYFGVLGNFVFFFYRFRVSGRRKKAISNFQLIEKIQSGNSLTATDREVIIYILRSIKLSPENINYLIIFLFSLLAIGLDIALYYLVKF
ncbi:hypothetical protein ACFLZ5_05810 [Thermodesulfobacteriota bacterium]